eukprot:scaffold3840_cov129-Cylindrotheca_fusiformis.AAC.15
MFLDQKGNLFHPTEATHGLKGCQRNGHFRFVVGISVRIGISGMQALCQLLVGVGLNGQCLSRTQYLEEKWQVFSNDVSQGFSRLELGMTFGVCPNPEFGIRRVRIHLVQRLTFEGVPGHSGIHPTDAPSIILGNGNESYHRPPGAIGIFIVFSHGNERLFFGW